MIISVLIFSYPCPHSHFFQALSPDSCYSEVGKEIRKDKSSPGLEISARKLAFYLYGLLP